MLLHTYCRMLSYAYSVLVYGSVLNKTAIAKTLPLTMKCFQRNTRLFNTGQQAQHSVNHQEYLV